MTTISPNKKTTTLQWAETTLRKGTKNPKICRDMFLTEYNGEFKLVVVKNGRLFLKTKITTAHASRLQTQHKLQGVKGIFNGSYAYRTKDSNKLVSDALNGRIN